MPIPGCTKVFFATQNFLKTPSWVVLKQNVHLLFQEELQVLFIRGPSHILISCPGLNDKDVELDF